MFPSNDTKFTYFSDNKGIGNLKSKSNAELKELLERQDKLVFNKVLISKLKDKGEKIQTVRNEIIEELESRKPKNSIKKQSKNSTAFEWKDSKEEPGNNDNNVPENDTDALQILSENGQIPNHDPIKSHITRMLEKERKPDFSFKPFNPGVAEKIKKVIPEAHTTIFPSLIKTIHLEESLNLLSTQMSALKILGARSKRVEECIEDRINESKENDQDNEDSEEHETKAGLGISVNLSN